MCARESQLSIKIIYIINLIILIFLIYPQLYPQLYPQMMRSTEFSYKGFLNYYYAQNYRVFYLKRVVISE